ncbi:glyoxylate reductase/hydroxypyruvate reductase isoform X1 [Musca domestica]|uniref:Glyoxylate reductase/hydroxypyruvate reductase isoform X1 n=2 Tax=Musca domestica TaxID=7370 RepID=A0A9J7DFZ2_MUSDO|nr:glyoxylate reductase/hydroxypyruvate reductase isoform X1 [Musca domestica]
MLKLNLFISLLIFGSLIAVNDAARGSRRGKMTEAPSTTPKVESSEENSSEEETFKILVTHPEVPQEALDLMSRGCKLIMCESLPPNRTEILQKAKGVHGMFWGSHIPLDKEVLDVAGPQLKSISTMSAGIDYVDVEELKKRKIPLGHTPIVLSDAVADLAMGLMLSAARRFHEGRTKIDSSTWENYHIEWMWGQDVRDSTVGFFGFGSIGQAIAKRLKGFDIERVLYTTRRPIDKKLEKQFNAQKVEFHELLGQSDFLFIAAPLTPETEGIFNSTAFPKMKKTAVLINIARGPIVNQDDLYTALKTNQIFSAGIDVMNPEPLPANDKLLTLPNIVITPHIGSATKRTRTDMATIAAHNVLRGLVGEPMLSPAY